MSRGDESAAPEGEGRGTHLHLLTIGEYRVRHLRATRRARECSPPRWRLTAPDADLPVFLSGTRFQPRAENLGTLLAEFDGFFSSGAVGCCFVAHLRPETMEDSSAGREISCRMWRFTKRESLENGKDRETIYSTAYNGGDICLGLFKSDDDVNWERPAIVMRSYDGVPSNSARDFRP